MNRQKDDAWREAQRRCQLNQEEVRMARELGFQPKSLIQNIPAPSQPWKRPVKEWVRQLYEEKIGSRRPAAVPTPVPAPVPPTPVHPGEERRNRDDPWPDNPVIAALPPLDLDAGNPYDDFDFGPPKGDDIGEEDGLMLRRQRLFRWAAQAIAGALSALPEVEKIAAFGAGARPLRMEVPRFREFRRYGIKILHECGDLDLAVWLNDLSRLREAKRAMSRGLALTHDTPYGGVAHHQVDVHVFDSASGQYRGRQCIFGECPKPRKIECLVPGCGEQPFLQQFGDYRFNPGRFFSEPKVILFDRSANLLVSPPNIVAPEREIKWIEEREPDEDFDGGIRDDDLPF